jgi:hypothetical protein
MSENLPYRNLEFSRSYYGASRLKDNPTLACPQGSLRLVFFRPRPADRRCRLCVNARPAWADTECNRAVTLTVRGIK